MEVPEIPTVESVREAIINRARELGRSWDEIARTAGITQSTLSRFLNGHTESMRYNHLERVVSAIRNPSIATDFLGNAGDVMSPHVLEVSVNDTVRAAITTMMKHRINQIPIFQLNPRKYEGVITIDSIRRLFLSGRNVDEILSMKLGELREKSGKNAQGILENPTPFRPDDDLVHIWQYLEGHYYAVVQNEDGLVVGMITRRSCLEPFSKLLNEVY